MDDVLAASALPYPEMLVEMERLEMAWHDDAPPWLPRISDTVALSPRPIAVAAARHTAQLRVAQYATDLVLAHWVDGAPPVRPPTDPFNGQPLRHRPTDTGFIVYSVGPNRRDNGGIANSRGSWREGDIVVEVRRVGED
jgi:hypothetical protein